MNDVKPEHIKKFKKLAREMNNLMGEITAYNQEANFYLEDAGNAFLMKGPTHNENANRPLHENIVASEFIQGSGGGGW